MKKQNGARRWGGLQVQEGGRSCWEAAQAAGSRQPPGPRDCCGGSRWRWGWRGGGGGPQRSGGRCVPQLEAKAVGPRRCKQGGRGARRLQRLLSTAKGGTRHGSPPKARLPACPSARPRPRQTAVPPRPPCALAPVFLPVRCSSTADTPSHPSARPGESSRGWGGGCEGGGTLAGAESKRNSRAPLLRGGRGGGWLGQRY